MENNLENLKRRLYKEKENFEERSERARIYREIGQEPANDWNQPKSKGKMTKQSKGVVKKFIFFFLFFLLISTGVVIYFLFLNPNIISAKNIGLEIKGPVYIEGGKLEVFNIYIENKNKEALEQADLIIDFPENTFSSTGEKLGRLTMSLGRIGSEESLSKSIELSFFGLENEEKKINTNLEYRIEESSAIFAKEYEYTIKISRVPIGLSVSIPKEISSKQELNVKIEAISNSESIAKNIYLEVYYPAGFQFTGSDIKPTTGNNIWSFGDIASLEKKEVNIKGFVEGQDLEEKVFNASIGAYGDDTALRGYGSASSSLLVKKPALDLAVFINGDNTEKNVANLGERMRVDLQWTNNLPNNIRDAVIEVEIKSDLYDEASISVANGDYRSLGKKIVWNSTNLGDLSLITPGATGKAQFSFSSLKDLPPGSKNSSIILNAKISGIGTSDQYQNKEIVNLLIKEIKLASKIQADTYGIYHLGPFINSGPLPPIVYKETKYTIVWSVGGNTSNFKNVKITASLPAYVQWLDSISPADSDISFDLRTGAIVWNTGDVSANTGLTIAKKEVYFQVAFIPSLNQVGTSPILVNGGKIEGIDDFTGNIVNFGIPPLNIDIIKDSQYKEGDGRVVKGAI